MLLLPLPPHPHPSISTHKYCSLRRSSPNRGKEGGRAGKRRETKREMSSGSFIKEKSYREQRNGGKAAAQPKLRLEMEIKQPVGV